LTELTELTEFFQPEILFILLILSQPLLEHRVVKSKFFAYVSSMDVPLHSNRRRSERDRQHRGRLAGTALVLFLSAIGLAARGAFPAKLPKGTMQLTSTAFKAGEAIPAQYTCDGKNISPPLQWTGTPAETKSFVLIVDDPDAPNGTWTHWLAYDLPSGTNELSENVPPSQFIAGKAKQGLNDFKRLGYGGPCPPPGKPHRYFFKLYALDALLDLKPGVGRREIEGAIGPHLLAQGQLIGTYQRK
jgi:Raf kinase inhibitor-like YbhB/YbcL family protein